MKRSLQTAVAAVALIAAGHAAAQITFYEREGFRGRSLTTDERMGNFDRARFNNRASSIVVEYGQWEVCEHPHFEGRCAILSRGGYPSLREIGLNNEVSSARPLEGYGRHDHDHGHHHHHDHHDHGRYDEAPAQPAVMVRPAVAAAPQPVVEERWHRRPNEAVYEVPVSSVRAVVGPPNQRCWIERQQVAQPTQAEPNIGGAVLGGIVGGILGHQVGGGSGKDLATVGGVMAGAVIGSKVATTDGTSRVVSRNVQRCETVANNQPEYWDVTYHFRGVVHHMQTTAPPGRTVLVNGQGEPRL